MKKLNWFNAYNDSLTNVKKRYRDLCKIYHPDLPTGNTLIMQDVNNEYEFIIKNQFFQFSSDYERDNFNTDYELIYPEIIAALLPLSGIKVELVGNWLWISGETKTHKSTLKSLGCLWASKKKMWYYRPEDYKSPNANPLDMEKIRDKYGSQEIVRNFAKQLSFF